MSFGTKTADNGRFMVADGLLCVEETPRRRDRLPCRVFPIGAGALAEASIRKGAHDFEALLERHGAILFEGFEVRDAPSFSDFASTLCPNLFEENFEHPFVEGSRKVYRTTPYPPHLPILPHNENSHLHAWPRLIIFGCLQPATAGGLTMLSDSAKVLERLPRRVTAEFERRGVRYQRVFGGGLGLDWRTAFRTDSKDVVDAACSAQGLDHVWLDESRLRVRWLRPALARHPASGAQLWFNQVTHFHPALLKDGFSVRLRGLFPPDELPRDCAYGDGGAIADEDARTIGKAFDAVEFGQPWKAGQVLLIDNMRLAHSRTPYSGERRLLVALGEIVSDIVQ